MSHQTEQFKARRLFARLVDMMLVGILARLLGPESFSHPESSAPFFLFVLYNILVILMGGASFGRSLLRLRLRQADRSKAKLVWRELFLWLLFPFVLLSFLRPGGRSLHDWLTQTDYILDEQRLSPYSLPHSRFDRI